MTFFLDLGAAAGAALEARLFLRVGGWGLV